MGPALRHLGIIQLPPYSSILSDTVESPSSVVPTIAVPEVSTPQTPDKASVSLPQNPVDLPAASPVGVPQSRSPSPGGDSTTDEVSSSAADWEEFGCNPIEFLSESDLPSCLHARPTNEPTNEPTNKPTNKPVGAPVTTLGLTVTVPPEERWYAVTVGRAPGVFRGSQDITPNVSGVPGMCVQKYPSQELAEKAYSDALDAGKVVRVEIRRCIVTRS
ncbi:hypothetical protein BD779DRAFT_1480637 [Infundibulicybe gibba]|nr:hypothetical protein BD779DRAFT_1480637 [Infundibulicybe gibba]